LCMKEEVEKKIVIPLFLHFISAWNSMPTYLNLVLFSNAFTTWSTMDCTPIPCFTCGPTACISKHILKPLIVLVENLLLKNPIFHVVLLEKGTISLMSTQDLI
jgi:hypothetical protein